MLGLPRATYYRWASPPKSKRPRPRPPEHALSQQERRQVLHYLHHPEFVDLAPYEVYASLLDRGIYLCSIRTMYRILEAEGEVKERRNQRRHPKRLRPELLATGPNQLWSWDITLLAGPFPGFYFFLYVIIDVYSRYVTGWLLAHHERAYLARQLIRQACHKQGIQPHQLIIHADNGPSMTSKSVAALLRDLAVERSFSRPYISNDNPYSEAHFKTLKYHRDFPPRFGSWEDARSFCRGFFNWYNKRHYHSGIALLHPEDLHYGRAQDILDKRNIILREAYALFPRRFSRHPVLFKVPSTAWINKPFPN